MVTTVMVPCGSERRDCEHHQKQGSDENLFHGLNLARKWGCRVEFKLPRIKTETETASGPGPKEQA
jgi:hypothetical protein